MSYLYNLMEEQSSNFWHDRWSVEGNYWLDYQGEDNGTDGRLAGDGIGDTDLPHKGVDNYPLMAPYLPSDVTHDGQVDMSDISIISAAYGSYPGHPKWNPHADINENAKVNIKDLTTAAVNNGKSWQDYWGS